MTTNRRILLKSRPEGLPGPQNFEHVEEDLQDPPADHILVRNIFLSLDPAIRSWMDDVESYFPPIGIGEPIRSTTVGQVVKSNHPDFKEGQYVLGLNGWEEYSITPGAGFTNVIDETIVPSISNYLSVLGAVGLTSYFGLLDVGKPKEGETVLVSAAAGAVGSLVGQIAKIKGCRAVGIAGSQEKCDWITGELGFDAAFNYKECNGVAELSAKMKETCPDGVDIYFENVGGDMLEAALDNMNEFGRIPVCGLISIYNETEPQPGPTNLWQLVINSLRVEGLLIKNYLDRFPEGAAQMATWLGEGKIKHREHIVDGLENAPDELLMLFDGRNEGKLIVKVGDV